MMTAPISIQPKTDSIVTFPKPPGRLSLLSCAKPILDKFNRPLTDLRLSVTSQCQLRCTYCRPQSRFAKKLLSTDLKQKLLKPEQILLIVQAFCELGVKKIRFTGGEPLLAPNLINLIGSVSKLKGITDTALTTNGLLLKEFSRALKTAGLKRLTVSLDTLNSEVYMILTGLKTNPISKILEGIKAAESASFQSIKINAVVIRGRNDQYLLDLVDHFRFSNHILRFIEYMDVGNINLWKKNDVFSVAEIHRLINSKWPLEPLTSTNYGEVAQRWKFKDGGGEIGFIASITEPFCGSCTRARLTADGKFSTCLFAKHFTDLGNLVRKGAGLPEIKSAIRDQWFCRADKYSENRELFNVLPTQTKRLEMFQIGG
jgi:GTP 3',8-cyclase